MRLHYTVVDVFTSVPLLGNPVAVVFDASDVDPLKMQAIASWINLPETTFVIPPTSPNTDYRVRIFTPRAELPFAGHPTIGTAYALLTSRRVGSADGRLRQQCEFGAIDLKVEKGGRAIFLELPPAKFTSLSDRQVAVLDAVLGSAVVRAVTPARVDVGASWIVAQIEELDDLLALKPDYLKCEGFARDMEVIGVTVFSRRPDVVGSIEVRSFAPGLGVNEDPACGSGNGAVAAFRQENLLMPPGVGAYVASQGRCLGRDARIEVRIAGSGEIWLGGACVVGAEGTLTL